MLNTSGQDKRKHWDDNPRAQGIGKRTRQTQTYKKMKRVSAERADLLPNIQRSCQECDIPKQPGKTRMHNVWGNKGAIHAPNEGGKGPQHGIHGGNIKNQNRTAVTVPSGASNADKALQENKHPKHMTHLVDQHPPAAGALAGPQGDTTRAYPTPAGQLPRPELLGAHNIEHFTRVGARRRANPAISNGPPNMAHPDYHATIAWANAKI